MFVADKVTCKVCGSTDVEVKAFIHQKSGYISYPETLDDEDTYCINCGEHTGVNLEFKILKEKK